MKKTTYSRLLTHTSYVTLSVFMCLCLLYSLTTAFAEDVAYPQTYMETEKSYEGNVDYSTVTKESFLSTEPPLPDVDGLTSGQVEAIINNKEFQSQVEALQKEADKAGTTLPPLATLIGLFAFAAFKYGGDVHGRNYAYVASQVGSKLKDFFSFDTLTKVVQKSVDVIRNFPVYTKRLITETITKPKAIWDKVAYTLKRTVQKAFTRTKTVTTSKVKYDSISLTERTRRYIAFIRKYYSQADSRTQRQMQYEMRYIDSYIESMADAENRAKTMRGRGQQRAYQDINNINQSLSSIVDRLKSQYNHSDPRAVAMHEDLQVSVFGKKTVTTTKKVKETYYKPVEEEYTEYRDEVVGYETESFEVEREVYDETFEQRVVGTVIKNEEVKVPVMKQLSTKIGAALSYIKNLGKVAEKPSNRSFDELLKVFRGGTAFEGCVESFSTIQSQLDNALREENAYQDQNGELPEEMFETGKLAVAKYNNFVQEMKEKAVKIRECEDMCKATFGFSLNELGGGTLAYYEDKVANLKKLKEELNSMSLSLSAYRVRYEGLSDKIKQYERKIRDEKKEIKEDSAFYTRRMHEMLDQIDRLAYLKDIGTYRDILAQTNVIPKISNINPNDVVGGQLPVFTGYSRSSIANFLATGGSASALPSTVQATVASIQSGQVLASDDVNLQTAGLLSGTLDMGGESSSLNVAVITDNNVNLRSSVTTSSSSVARLKEGNVVRVIESKEGQEVDGDATWLHVELADGTRGWVSKTLATTTNASAVVNAYKKGVTAYVTQKLTNLTRSYPKATVIASALTLRTSPNGASAGTVKNGEVLDVLGKSSDQSWLKVKLSDGTEGWVGGNPSYIQYDGMSNIAYYNNADLMPTVSLSEVVKFPAGVLATRKIPTLTDDEKSKLLNDAFQYAKQAVAGWSFDSSLDKQSKIDEIMARKYRELVLERQGEIAKVQSDSVVVEGEFSLSLDPVRRKKENIILGKIAAKLPFEKQGNDIWYNLLGSPFHSNDAYYAADFNIINGNDSGRQVRAVASGVISAIDLSFGAVTIDHPETSDMPEWQSKYLHLPIYETGELTADGKKIYVMGQDAVNDPNALRIWEGKQVTATDVIGEVSGRGISSDSPVGVDEEGRTISDSAFGSHLHFEAVLDGQSINLTRLLNSEVIGLQSKAFPQGKEVNFSWSYNINSDILDGALVNQEEKLIYFRDPGHLDKNIARTDHIRAWEEGKKVEDMAEVIWDKDLSRWVHSLDKNLVWNPLIQSFNSI